VGGLDLGCAFLRCRGRSGVWPGIRRDKAFRTFRTRAPGGPAHCLDGSCKRAASVHQESYGLRRPGGNRESRRRLSVVSRGISCEAPWRCAVIQRSLPNSRRLECGMSGEAGCPYALNSQLVFSQACMLSVQPKSYTPVACRPRSVNPAKVRSPQPARLPWASVPPRLAHEGPHPPPSRAGPSTAWRRGRMKIPAN